MDMQCELLQRLYLQTPFFSFFFIFFIVSIVSKCGYVHASVGVLEASDPLEIEVQPV